MQVRPHDADMLEAALPQAHRLNLVGGTHTLKASVAGDPYATYADPTLPLHEDLVPGIVKYIGETTKSE